MNRNRKALYQNYEATNNKQTLEPRYIAVAVPMRRDERATRHAHATQADNMKRKRSEDGDSPIRQRALYTVRGPLNEGP